MLWYPVKMGVTIVQTARNECAVEIQWRHRYDDTTWGSTPLSLEILTKTAITHRGMWCENYLISACFVMTAHAAVVDTVTVTVNIAVTTRTTDAKDKQVSCLPQISRRSLPTKISPSLSSHPRYLLHSLPTKISPSAWRRSQISRCQCGDGRKEFEARAIRHNSGLVFPSG